MTRLTAWRGVLILTLLPGLGCRSGEPVQHSATVAELPALPPIPDGPLGVSVRRGLAILMASADSLPDQVGNDLNCTSCHLDQGRRPNGLSWVGVYSQFPTYRARDGRVATIEDRINGCLLRSMNGHRLAADDDRMRDMVAYLSYLSIGIAPGDSVPGRGLRRPDGLSGDTVLGSQIWQRECARCHGDNGQGTAAAPPTWGPRSFNIGAGMARFRTAAGFIKANMPFDRPGSLSDHEAEAVAAWLISRDRPDLPGKERDWPNGDAPADAAYITTAAAGR